MTQEDNNQNISSPPKKSKWLGRLGGLLFFLFIVLITLFSLLQTQKVQTYLVEYISDILSKKLECEVSVARVSLDFPDILTLEGVILQDLNKDTLLVADKIQLDNSSTILELMQQKLKFEGLVLRGVNFELHREPDQYLFNITKWIKKLNNQPVPDNFDPYQGALEAEIIDTIVVNEVSDLELSIKYVTLEQVTFFKNDKTGGQKLYIEVPSGSIEVDSLDLEVQNKISLKSAIFNNPIVKISDNPRNEQFWEEMWDKDYAVKQKYKHVKGYKPSIQILSKRISINDGVFIFDNNRNLKPRYPNPDDLDINHLWIEKVNVEAENFWTQSNQFKGKIKHLSCKEASGFEIKEAYSDSIIVSSGYVLADKTRIKTKHSDLQERVSFDFECYEDWVDDFPNLVDLNLNLKKSKIAVADLLDFIPNLRNNPFFVANREKVFDISGEAHGTVNQLIGDNIQLKLGKEALLEGSFLSSNLMKAGQRELNLDLTRLETNMLVIRKLIPNLNLPRNFDKLGNIKFSGSSSGFLLDLVAYGKLESDIGSSEIDLRLNTKEGENNAQYSGKIKLIDFDLKTWTENDKLGKINAYGSIQNGQGLELKSLFAELEAHISSVEFNNYTYKNINYNGKVEKKKIDGKLDVHSEDLDLDFVGTIDLNPAHPIYDFDAEIRNIDFQKLNFSKQARKLNGNMTIDLIANSIADIQGDIILNNFEITSSDTIVHHLDKAHLTTDYDSISNLRNLSIRSELLNLDIDGRFQIDGIDKSFNNYLIHKFPEIAYNIGLQPKYCRDSISHFKLDLEIFDTKNWLLLAHPKVDTLKNTKLAIRFDDRDSFFDMNLSCPKFVFDNHELENLYGYANFTDKISDIEIDIKDYFSNGKRRFGPLNIFSDIKKSQVNFDVQIRSFAKIVRDFKIEGQMDVLKEGITLKFEPADLTLFNEKWSLLHNNKISIKDKKISVNNFELNSDDRSVKLRTDNGNNLIAGLKNIDLSFLDNFWKDQNLDLSGKLDIDINIKELMAMKDIDLDLSMDTLFINNDPWGVLDIKLNTESLKHPFIGSLSLDNNPGSIDANINIYPKNMNPEYLPSHRKAGEIELDARASEMQVNFAQYFLKNICSNITGTFDARLKLEGPGKFINSNGYIDFKNTAFDVNYLKTHYRLKDHRVIIDNDLFDATGAILLDKFDNEATLTGGMTHIHLKKLGLDASLQSERFLGLETTKLDNPVYYGTGIGKIDVNLTGFLTQPSMIINATSGIGTQLSIPVDYTADGSETSFVEFIDEDKIDSAANATVRNLTGMDVEMNLSITDLADMSIIFDEQAGDILKGRGFGNLQILAKRTGDFKLYGNYEVESGDYLFTYNKYFINKHFNVQKGGTIQWTGDPFNAELNITALHSINNVSTYHLISDLIENGLGDLQTAANQGTDVDLKMFLTGPLLKPNINFDLDFAYLPPPIRPLVNDKLRILKQDEGELNKQVFGLIMMGNFLPSNSLGNTNSFVASTLTQWLSSQVSLYFSDLLTQIFEDIGFVNGVDFNVSFNQSEVIAGNSNLNSNNLSLELKNSLFNNRVQLSFGGNFGLNNENTDFQQNNGLTSGNVELEYFITQDRQLKLNVYTRFDDDILNNARYRTGTGITFRKEFDDFSDLINIFNSTKKSIEETVLDSRGE